MITGRIGVRGARVAFFTQEEVNVLAQGRTWEGLPEWCQGLPVVPLETLLAVGDGQVFVPDGCVAYAYGAK